jgi:outer membrane receptor for ferrienterochelin and colicins
MGGGYKAPDFRQLILNFTNPVAGYTVVGSSILSDVINELESSGQIQQILINPENIQEIEAEQSLAYNLGTQISKGKFNLELNFFRNQISNLIDTSPIARKTNGQNVFSYLNFNRVVTQGVELQTDYSVLQNLEFSAGYQYLDSRDVDAVEAIKNGEVFTRNPQTNGTVAMELSDYAGLPNRSRHSGNLKLFYTNSKQRWDASLRAIYRGPWGLGDANGNGVIERSTELASGYWLLNLALNKEVFKAITIELGSNNLMNTTNAFEPSLAGRIWYGGIRIRLEEFFNN